MPDLNKPLRNRFEILENSLLKEEKESPISSPQKWKSKKLPDEHLLHTFESLESINWSKNFLTYSIKEQQVLFYQLENKMKDFFHCLKLTFEYRAFDKTMEMVSGIRKFQKMLDNIPEQKFNQFSMTHVIFEYYGNSLYIELQCIGEQRLHYANYLLLKESLLNDYKEELKIYINEDSDSTQILISLNNKRDS